MTILLDVDGETTGGEHHTGRPGRVDGGDDVARVGAAVLF
jgi:hypothetical protein